MLELQAKRSKNSEYTQAIFDSGPSLIVKRRIEKGLCCAILKYSTRLKHCKHKAVGEFKGKTYCKRHLEEEKATSEALKQESEAFNEELQRRIDNFEK